MTPMKLELFSRRVRALLEKKNITIGALAEKAGLDSSLVSKLLSDAEASRREPRIEHVMAIAIALDMTPHELAAGTTAEAVLGQWVPREELEKESKARVMAQARVGNLETELAASKAEAAAARNELDRLSAQMAQLEANARQQIYNLRVSCQATEAKLGACIVERDNAVQSGIVLGTELANAHSRLVQAHGELVAAKGSASAGWLTAILAGGFAIGAAAAADKPKRRSPGRPRGS